MTTTVLHNEPVFVPGPRTISASQLTAFTAFCENKTGRSFRDQAAFYRFSVEEFRSFWALFVEWAGLGISGALEPICTDDSCERAVFFPDATLNYAASLLRPLSAEVENRPAVIACHDGRPADVLSRRELRERVAGVAAGLLEIGIEPGTRMVAIAGNDAEAIVGALAATAVGATVSTASPDMGAFAIVDRFRQLAPSVLLARFGQDADGADGLSDRVVEVVRNLPSLELVVALDEAPVPDGISLPTHRLSEFPPRRGGADNDWPQLPFNQPLFILFSSGTTGPPKCIVHGAGGTLLEHAKEHRLHVDLGPSDTMFFHTSTAWMMWNWQLSALEAGATVVAYDGHVRTPDTLWRIVAEHDVTVFGTSPPYLRLCEEAGFSPRREFRFGRLRSILSTGSILPDGSYAWIDEEVGHLPVQSISGGTDILGCFVLGSPNLPVYRGESQCRSLGLDVRALPSDLGDGVEVGELICANPFPSRPVGFVADDGSAFHKAYFAANEGVWTHGDLIEITPSGGARLHGRSDAVLNIGGRRIGPAEIYRVVEAMPEVREAMAVEQRTSGAEGSRMVLLVVLRVPGTLDSSLRARIRRELARGASPAHVPAVIAEVRELPQTHSGKRSESAARDVLNGMPVRNQAALRNPQALHEIETTVQRTEARQAARLERDDALPLLETIASIWEEALDISPIGLEENFFDLGGTSLAALRVVDALAARYGRELPQSALMQAPTIESMAKLMSRIDVDDFSPVIRLNRRRTGAPLALIHGVFGEVFEFQPLLERLRYDGPIYGVRARGLDPSEEPHSRLEEMARYYIEHLRRAEPDGPYALLGFSFGGLVAFEMARELKAAGAEVAFLGLLDTDVHERCLPLQEWAAFALRKQIGRAARAAAAPRTKVLPFILERAARVVPGLEYEREPSDLPPSLQRVQAEAMKAFRRYRPRPYDGPATLFRAEVRRPEFCDALPVWSGAVTGALTVRHIGGDHVAVLREPAVDDFARVLSSVLADTRLRR